MRQLVTTKMGYLPIHLAVSLSHWCTLRALPMNIAIESAHCGCVRNLCKDWVWSKMLHIITIILYLTIIPWCWESSSTLCTIHPHVFINISNVRSTKCNETNYMVRASIECIFSRKEYIGSVRVLFRSSL